MTRTQTASVFAAAFAAAGLTMLAPAAQAGPYSATVFATGTAVSGTQPDSITIGGGHVFVEYGNGANSSAVLGTGGASTIAEYDLSGNVLNTFSVLGSADGVRYNSSTNQLWVLQNQDGNSALTILDPATSAKTRYSYSAPYDPTAGRGFDDVQFVGGNAYLSYSNPASPTDPIIVQATLGAGTVSITPVLADTFNGNTVADPDSLDQTPAGDLLLTGGDDGTLTTVHNPGAAQTTSFVALTDATGKAVRGLDDVTFAGSGPQELLVSDTATNTVYALSGPFTPGTAYGSIGSTHSVDSVDLTTGAVSSITDGLFAANAGPHGLAFLPAAVPEASTTVSFGLLLALGMGGVVIAAKRKKAVA